MKRENMALGGMEGGWRFRGFCVEVCCKHLGGNVIFKGLW